MSAIARPSVSVPAFLKELGREKSGLASNTLFAISESYPELLRALGYGDVV